MFDLKSSHEIKLIREGGKILARVLQKVARAAEPGLTTNDLNKLTRELIFSYGAKPAFEGYKSEAPHGISYPAALCTSVNDEIVHAIPGKRVLQEGDIIGLDLGVVYKGFFTDMAVTVGIGKIGPKAEQLLKITKKSLEIGICQVAPGNYIGDIGSAIQEYVESHGFSVVRQLVGHGVGRAVHEEPQIPNYGKPKTGEMLQPGMVLAIEPMVTVGSYRIKSSNDGFGFRTVDGSLSAHFEHTVVVTKKGCEVVTNI